MVNQKLATQIRKAYVFDLDHTVIDSTHRVNPCLRPNGDLDLAKYVAEACTDEKIANDTLLPLAAYMQQLIEQGEKVIILTARDCNNADYVFLRKNGLKPCIHLSRDQLSRVFAADIAERAYYLGDAEYKKFWFEHLFETLPNYEFKFFDDHDGVLAMADKLAGVSPTDAKLLNDILSHQWADMYRQGEQAARDELEDYIAECSEKDIILKPEYADILI